MLLNTAWESYPKESNISLMKFIFTSRIAALWLPRVLTYHSREAAADLGFIPHGNIIFSEGKVDWPYCGPIVMCWILIHFAPVIWCMNAVNCAWWRTVTVWVALIETLMLTYLLCPDFFFFLKSWIDFFTKAPFIIVLFSFLLILACTWTLE